MAGKKDQLALFELVHQGEKKSGSWLSRFRRSRTDIVGDQGKVVSSGKVDLRPGHGAINQKSQAAEVQAPHQVESDIPVSSENNTIPTPAAIPTSHESNVTSATPDDEHNVPSMAGISDKRINLNMPYWIIGLSVLALVLVLLIAFQLGQGGDSGESAGNNPGGDGVAASVGDGFDKDKIEKRDINQVAGGDGAAERKRLWNHGATPGGSANKPTNTAGIAQKPPVNSEKLNYLVAIGHKDIRGLQNLAKFFEDKGLPVNIGKEGNRYVLITKQGFAKRDKETIKKLKNRVENIGNDYYNVAFKKNSPAEWPIFRKKDFSDAYATALK